MGGNWWGISTEEIISGGPISHHISSSGKIQSGLYVSACGRTVKLNMHASKMKKCQRCLDAVEKVAKQDKQENKE